MTNSRGSGYTLLELMTAVAIISILVGVSLPALRLSEQKQAEQLFLQLSALISAARASAISLHADVVICPLSSSNTCSNNWNKGVIVFVDSNRDRQLSSGEIVIDQRAWEMVGTLQWRAFGNRQNIAISPLGEIRDQNGNFTWCPPAGSPIPGHQLILNSSGRMRLADTSIANGSPLDSQGRPINCS